MFRALSTKGSNTTTFNVIFKIIIKLKFNNNFKSHVRQWEYKNESANITIVKINHWMIEIAYYGWNINRAILWGFLTFKRTCKRCCYQNWYLWLIYMEDWSFELSKVSFILLEKYGARSFYYERQKWLGLRLRIANPLKCITMRYSLSLWFN
jgi:hypothetical protein